ncbi:GxxExxY protein [Lachnospiraceae bacterium 56-18]
MDLVLEKFVSYYNDIYSDNDSKFLEEHGRKIFLLYLKPIINGTGNYYIEAQTRDARRTDVVVDYLGEQFVIEIKLWRGAEYNERGEKQLTDYLDYYHLKKGYLLSFNFNKKKKTGIREFKFKDRTIIEAIV